MMGGNRIGGNASFLFDFLRLFYYLFYMDFMTQYTGILE